MNLIPFTRLHLPNGRRTEETTEVGNAEFKKYQELSKMGFRMTIEVLSLGPVSMCIEDPGLGDFDIIFAKNGPEVPKQLSKMLLRFDAKQAAEWRKEMKEREDEP